MKSFQKIALLALLGLVAALPLAAEVVGTIEVDEDILRGADADGHVLLYTPDPVVQGSSMSHWDPSAFPNLLMEPSINSDLNALELDITPAQMRDIGWQTGGTSTISIFPFSIAPETGFDDPRPFGGAPGNPATTLGEARANLFEAVIGAWANTLASPVDIEVLVVWLPDFCDPGLGAVLASAGAIFQFRDGPGFPRDNTWFHAALAEAIVGFDVTGPPAVDENGFIVGGDVVVFVNDQIDNECLGPGTGYYYGIDGNNPPNTVDLGPVVLHEFAHGIGFSNFTNETTGERCGICEDLPGIFDVFAYDNLMEETWAEMDTAAERRISATNTRQVVWIGEEVTEAAPAFLEEGTPVLILSGDPEVAGTYPIGTASFGPPVDAVGLSGEIECVVDNLADPTIFNGCSNPVNGDDLEGKIALVDRGSCTFATKAQQAQDEGAIAVIIANNAGNTPNALGGEDPNITIPVISVGADTGRRIREAACGNDATFLNNDRFQVSAKFRSDETEGVAQGMPLTDDTGWFYFFNHDNVELVVKVLNACSIPEFNNYWVFAAGLTDVEVELTVLDTKTGVTKTYLNELGTPFQPIQDTQAFDTCP